MRNTSHRTSSTLQRLEGRSPEDVIPYLLKSLHHTLRQVLDESFRRDGIEISFAHLSVLLELEAEPGLVGAELARRTFVTAQTISTILNRLERDGQIERRPHPATLRADRWFVTRAGQKQLDAATIVGRSVWRRMLGTLAAREAGQLRDLLSRCLVGLEAQVGASESKPASRGRRPPSRKAKRAK